MSKAAKILALLEKLPDAPERTVIIAKRVGCEPAYVRAVRQREAYRQRHGTTWRDFDRRWYYENHPKRLVQMRAWRRANKA